MKKQILTELDLMIAEILPKLDSMNSTINNIEKKLVAVESNMVTKDYLLNSQSKLENKVCDDLSKIMDRKIDNLLEKIDEIKKPNKRIVLFTAINPYFLIWLGSMILMAEVIYIVVLHNQ